MDICIWNVWVRKYATTKADRHLREQSNHESSFGEILGRQAYVPTWKMLSVRPFFVLVKNGGHLNSDAQGVSEGTSLGGMQ